MPMQIPNKYVSAIKNSRCFGGSRSSIYQLCGRRLYFMTISKAQNKVCQIGSCVMKKVPWNLYPQCYKSLAKFSCEWKWEKNGEPQNLQVWSRGYFPIRDTEHNLKEETAEQQTCGREIFTLSAVLPQFFFHLVKELDSRNVHVLLFHRLLLFCARINGADLMPQDDLRVWIDFSLFSTVFGFAGTRWRPI